MARSLPYARGARYWADLDSKIRAASGGGRKLNDVMLALFERREGGKRLDQNSLVEALVKEIGPSARTEFDAVVVRGETITPASDAFGPCFERRPTKFTAQETKVDGFEWVRVPTIPDERCRTW